MLGVGVPVAVGSIQAAASDEPAAADASVHAGMAGMDMATTDVATTLSWLGSAEWYYGAMIAVLALGALHALLRHRRNACGSTPLGMGIMWGSMVAMSLGMAVGVH